MTGAIEILNRILDTTAPGEWAVLQAMDASLLGTLSRRELGDLSDRVCEIGVLQALQKEGLFGRKIAIV